MTLPKRFTDRAKTSLRRYQKILTSAHTRDVNESDTVLIVTDFLSDVLGYDKYEEITTEFAVRGTYCDLAVKVGGRIHFLMEVKAIGKGLQDTHLRQAIDYGAKQGVDWVVLTNGVVYQAHRLRFEKPIQHDLVFEIDLLAPDAKPAHLLETLYLLSKEASKAGAMEKYRATKEAANRFVMAQLVLGEDAVKLIRRELRRMSPGVKITEEEVAEVLRSEVLKRDVVEGDRPKEAARAIRRAARRRSRQSKAEPTPAGEAEVPQG